MFLHRKLRSLSNKKPSGQDAHAAMRNFTARRCCGGAQSGTRPSKVEGMGELKWACPLCSCISFRTDIGRGNRYEHAAIRSLYFLKVAPTGDMRISAMSWQWYRADRERNLPLFDSEGSILAIGQASKKLKKSDNSDNNVD